MSGYYWSLKVRGRKYSADQPRVPAGDPKGGQWTSGGGPSGTIAEGEEVHGIKVIGSRHVNEMYHDSIREAIRVLPKNIRDNLKIVRFSASSRDFTFGGHMGVLGQTEHLTGGGEWIGPGIFDFAPSTYAGSAIDVSAPEYSWKGPEIIWHEAGHIDHHLKKLSLTKDQKEQYADAYADWIHKGKQGGEFEPPFEVHQWEDTG